MGEVRSIGDGAWAGEDMCAEEVDGMVDFLERAIGDIRAGKIRGFTFAGVSESGLGSNYLTTVLTGTGCSTLCLVGAANLVAFDVAALHSKVIEED